MLDTAAIKASKTQGLAYAVKGQISHLEDLEDLEGMDGLRDRAPENEEVLWGAAEFEGEGYGESHHDEEEGPDNEFDSMKMYLKAIGRIPLLTKEEEVALALRIEHGRERLAALVFSIPFALKRLVTLGNMVERGEIPLGDIAIYNGNGEGPGLEDIRCFYRQTEAVKGLYQRRRPLAQNGTGKASRRSCGYTVTASDGVSLSIPCREVYGTAHKKIIERIIALRLREDMVGELCEELSKGVSAIDALVSPSGNDGRSGKSVRVPAAARKTVAEYEERFGIPYAEMKQFLKTFGGTRLEIVEAKNAMSEGNLRLVVSVAKRFIGKGLSFPDLVQEGNIGLMKAIDKFDCRKGFRFSTYAIWWIRQAIKRALDDKSRMIRVPVTILEVTKQVSRARRELTHERQEDPTLYDIAERLRIPMGKLVSTMKLTREPLSLEMPIGDEDGHLSDFIQDGGEHSPICGIVRQDLKRQVERLLVTLSPKEERILRLRFGIGNDRPYSLEEIAQEYDVTRERIRQIETKAIQKLREPAMACELEEFIEH